MTNTDPRVKLLWVLLCTTGGLMFFRPGWMLGAGLFTLAGTLAFGADLDILLGRIRRFLPILSFVLVIHILFVQTGTAFLVLKGFPLVTSDGIMRGVTALLRFFVILCCAAVMAGENSRRVLAALTKLKVPYLFAFQLMIALRFIPVFTSSFSDALTALQLRGVELESLPLRRKLRLYADLLLPVVADAVVKSRVLAVVMEARGFGAFDRRTSYLEIRMAPRDWALVSVLLGLGITAFACYFFA